MPDLRRLFLFLFCSQKRVRQGAVHDCGEHSKPPAMQGSTFGLPSGV